MTARKYSSTVVDMTLSAEITASATSMTVSPYASLPSVFPFTLVINPDTTNEEIVTVTARTNGLLTIVRSQDGTSAPSTHSLGTPVKHMVTARDLQEPQDHIYATSGIHGLTGSPAGVTDTQTLTNKTINGANNTLTNISQSSVNGLVADLALKAPLASPTLTSPTMSNPTITGTLTLPSGSVTSTMIADGTIVNADINSSAAIDKTKISGTAITAADTGTVTNTMLAGSISPSKITGTALVANDTSYLNPTGMLAPFAGSTAPTGWLLCDGSTKSTTANPELATLFSVIGTTYGGTGASSFKVPDLRGRVPAGLDNMSATMGDAGRLDWTDTLGTNGGTQTVTLTSAQSGVPAHTHPSTTGGTHGHTIQQVTGGNPSGTGYEFVINNSSGGSTLSSTNSGHSHAVTANTAADAASAHNNMQPTILLNYIIKY